MVTLAQTLRNHLTYIARERDPFIASGGHFFVREYIREQLAQWGKVTNHEFTYRDQQHQNIILDLPGNQPNLPPILIGAHYDGVPGTVAADDNGTGVAVLLELAANFAKNPLKYPIRIVAFDLEEYGLVGSAAYAAYLKKKQQSLRLMISLEMLGYCDPRPNSQSYPADILQYFYPNCGNFLALVGNLRTIPDLLKMQRQISSQLPCWWLSVPNNGKWIQGTGFSDHSPFWLQGYKAIMATDTAFLRNPHYHKATDTIDTIDFDFMRFSYLGLVKALRTLR